MEKLIINNETDQSGLLILKVAYKSLRAHVIWLESEEFTGIKDLIINHKDKTYIVKVQRVSESWYITVKKL